MRVERLLGPLNGLCGCDTNNESKVKAPPTNTGGGTPKIVEGFRSGPPVLRMNGAPSLRKNVAPDYFGLRM